MEPPRAVADGPAGAVSAAPWRVAEPAAGRWPIAGSAPADEERRPGPVQEVSVCDVCGLVSARPAPVCPACGAGHG